jgi:Zn-dependent protease
VDRSSGFVTAPLPGGMILRIHVFMTCVVVAWAFAGRSNYLETLQILMVGMASLFIHEAAHVLAARLFGVRASSIDYYGFAGAAVFPTGFPSWRSDFVTTAAGPLSNALLAGLFYHLYFEDYFGEYRNLDRLIHIAFWVNGTMAVFNLLPIHPFDGGQLLRLLLAPIIGPLRAQLVTSAIAVVGGLALAAVGVLKSKIYLVIIGFIVGWKGIQNVQEAWRDLTNRRSRP